MPFNPARLGGSYRRESTSIVTWLICAIAGAFVIEFAADSSLLRSPGQLSTELAFSGEAVFTGRVWTPFTFWLLHDTANLFHVGAVLMGLMLLGPEIVRDVGSQRFLVVFFASLLAGATAWGLLNFQSEGSLIGATAGLYGLIAVFALLRPQRETGFLLFFLFPIRFRPKHLALALLTIESCAFVLIELFGRSLPFSYAPSSHLGGMLMGWACFRFWRQGGGLPLSVPGSSARREPRAREALSSKAANDPGMNSRADIRREVDRILDKINSRGLDALSSEERRILDEAKDLLSRR